jgi:DNA-binding XRE family transcriptional regulator
MAVTELEKARAELGLTQEEVAQAAGVIRATIIRAEAGRPPGYYATKLRIARALNSTPDALWPETQEATA